MSGGGSGVTEGNCRNGRLIEHVLFVRMDVIKIIAIELLYLFCRSVVGIFSAEEGRVFLIRFRN